MPEINQRKRTRLWWMEEGEVLDDGHRLEEATRTQEKYDPLRLKPGWSGRNAPPVESMGSGYVKDGESRFDKLGKGTSGEKTKKGDGQKKAPEVKEIRQRNRKRVSEGDLDLDLPDEGMEDQGMGDESVNPENDVPPEMEDDAMEGEDSEELAQDVKVEIDGKMYTLVPEEEPEMGDEEGMGEEEPDMMGEEPAMENGGVASEPDDITRQESKRKNRRAMKEAIGEPVVDDAEEEPEMEEDIDTMLKNAMREAKVNAMKKQKEAAVRKAIQGKKYYEKKLAELFTGEYVKIKQGEPGFDFKDVAGDESFAVIDRAASGNQYTPIDSESPYEPDSKGGKTTHMTKPKGGDSYGESPYNKPNPYLAKTESTKKDALKKKKEDFNRWLAAQERKFNEDEHPGVHKAVNPDEDPGDTAEEFNKQDEFGLAEPRSPISPKQYPQIPEIMGNEKDVITPSNGQKYGKGNFVGESKKMKDIQQRRKIRYEAIEGNKSETLPVLEESTFDFKKLIQGDY